MATTQGIVVTSATCCLEFESKSRRLLRKRSSSSLSFRVRCSARHSKDPQTNLRCAESSEREKWKGERLMRKTVAVIAAGVLVTTAGEAMAAKSGGRVGGQAFRSYRSAPSPPPRSSPRVDNSRTNLFINPPPIAPPLFGGYGFGGSPFFGGWGWSPFSFFAGPSLSIGIGGGFEIFVFFLVLGIVGNIVRSIFSRNNADDDADDFYD